MQTNPTTTPAAGPGNPPATASQQELLRKAELEAALIAAPQDARIRAAYFDELVRFATVRTGLSHVLLPELGYPLALRCGTPDLLGLLRVFRDRAYDLPMRATPQRIVVLGGYVGYAAVFLAQRFPTAHIVCVEPSAAAFRMMVVNTLPYRRLQPLNAAVWHSFARLGVMGRLMGDWGLQLHDQLPDAERTVAAIPMAEILRLAGWDRVDFVLCDILGAERAVFADPGQRWLRTLDTLAIEVHDPEVSDQVAACFDPAVYRHDLHGEVHLHERITPFRAVSRPPPREMPLISSEPGLFPLALQDVQQTAWGFFVFDGESCQLHPNPPGERPARAIFPRTLDGQTRFTTTLRHAGRIAHGVTFSLVITREDGSEAFRAARTVGALEQQEVLLDLPALHGRHHVILQTEMAAGAPNNYNGWAQFLSPRIG